MPRNTLRIAIRSLLAAALATPLVACSGGTPSPEQSPTAGPPQDPTKVTVLHVNVHQSQDDAILEYVVDQVTARHPTLISLNEVCEGDYDYWVRELGELGYAGNFAGSERTGNCAQLGDWEQGTAIFVSGGARPGSETDYAAGQSTACITRNSLPAIVGCSTHINAPNGDNPDIAKKDIEDLRAQVLSEFDHLPLVVAGDFNVDPWAPEIQGIYGDFYELDSNASVCMRDNPKPPPASEAVLHGGRCTFKHDEQGWKKLDYIFVDREHFEPDVSAAVRFTCGGNTVDNDCSDHKQVFGVAQLKVDHSETGEDDTVAERGYQLSISPAYNKREPWCDDNASSCQRPEWGGDIIVNRDGTVTGAADLWVNLLEFCDNIGGGFVVQAEQQLKVDGKINGGNGDATLTLTFKKPKINADPVSCRNPEGQLRRYRDYLERTITVDEKIRVEVPGLGKEHEAQGRDGETVVAEQEIELNGRPYKFRLTTLY